MTLSPICAEITRTESFDVENFCAAAHDLKRLVFIWAGYKHVRIQNTGLRSYILIPEEWPCDTPWPIIPCQYNENAKLRLRNCIPNPDIRDMKYKLLVHAVRS